MKVETHKYPAPFGDITLVRLVNASGEAVTLSSLGAGIIAVEVADRNGKIENVALSYKNPADYMDDPACMGRTPGRYAGHIARGRFSLDGKEHTLPINIGPDSMHGGPKGFHNRLWNTETFSNGVRFTLESKDGDAGYPADLRAAVEYRWNDEADLSVSYSAESDGATVVNLTNHAYWNLNGADAGDALSQLMRIKASAWLPTDATLIPLGEIEGVDGTPLDFLDFHPIGERIEAQFPTLRQCNGYDNCWVLDREIREETREDGAEVWIQNTMVRDALVLTSPKTGREMHIDTDQPGIQVYTANGLGGSPENVSGRSYDNYAGIAIEPQGFPDAPNHPDFPSQRVDPDHPYFRTTVYRFRH